MDARETLGIAVAWGRWGSVGRWGSGGSLEASAGSILAPVNHGEPGIPGVPFQTI